MRIPKVLVLDDERLVQLLRYSGDHSTRAGSFLGMNRDQILYRIGKLGCRRLSTVGENHSHPEQFYATSSRNCSRVE